jgi:hypothetical protein
MLAFPRKMPEHNISDRFLSCFGYSILAAFGPPLSLSTVCGCSTETGLRFLQQVAKVITNGTDKTNAYSLTRKYVNR